MVEVDRREKLPSQLTVAREKEGKNEMKLISPRPFLVALSLPNNQHILPASKSCLFLDLLLSSPGMSSNTSSKPTDRACGGD